MNPNDTTDAYRLRLALREGLDNIPAASAERLAKARHLAVRRKKAESTGGIAFEVRYLLPAGAGHGNFHLFTRLGAAIPVLAGIVLFVSLWQAEHQERIHDAADIDVAVLSDELPLSAYLDRGFNAFIANGGE
jgi:hypothetical protein